MDVKTYEVGSFKDRRVPAVYLISTIDVSVFQKLLYSINIKIEEYNTSENISMSRTVDTYKYSYQLKFPPFREELTLNVYMSVHEDDTSTYKFYLCTNETVVTKTQVGVLLVEIMNIIIHERDGNYKQLMENLLSGKRELDFEKNLAIY